ncbi:MAG: adenine phosphoribosyltransferase [Chloroflexi bacterium]|nr:adenine phosphoribosyltransferase [Chloroflexota bacterium]
MDLARLIRAIPDFPVKGILFRDITTLIRDGEAFQEAIDVMVEHYIDTDIDVVAAVEARGWIFGAPLAYELGAGFVPIRKPSKLPADKLSLSYSLEYGANTLEVHRDAIAPGTRVLLVDDLLATGGSARAAAELVEKLGGKVVGIAFLIELVDLHGRDKLKDYEIYSMIQFEGE